MSVSLDQASLLVQHHTMILDVGRDPVGTLAQVYVHDETSEPLWAAVVFDPPSDVETVVPIHDAHIEGGDLVTNYTRSVMERTGLPQVWLTLGVGGSQAASAAW